MADAKRTRVRPNVSALVDEALADGGTVIIKRPGRRDVAIIPAERLRDLDTTDYLMSSPKNRTRLLTALRNARRGKGRAMTVAQLRKQIGLVE
jgi:antitoxin YefM